MHAVNLTCEAFTWQKYNTLCCSFKDVKLTLLKSSWWRYAPVRNVPSGVKAFEGFGLVCPRCSNKDLGVMKKRRRKRLPVHSGICLK